MMTICGIILTGVLYGVVMLCMGCIIISKSPKRKIKNKNILVIGGTHGLGKELARQLYNEENKVTITSRKINDANKAVSEIKKLHDQNITESADSAIYEVSESRDINKSNENDDNLKNNNMNLKNNKNLNDTQNDEDENTNSDEDYLKDNLKDTDNENTDNIFNGNISNGNISSDNILNGNISSNNIPYDNIHISNTHINNISNDDATDSEIINTIKHDFSISSDEIYNNISENSTTTSNVDSNNSTATITTSNTIADKLYTDKRINAIQLDILEDIPLVNTEYDIIFCIPGYCISKYFRDQELNDFKNQMNLNYNAVVNTLMHFRKNNNKPFTFVSICSTAGIFYIPGYSSYAPTKSALYTFYCCVYPEMQKENIDMRLFIPGTINTKALKRENKTKPEFTKNIEYTNTISTPKPCAKYIIDNLYSRRFITIDWFTYFVLIRDECQEIQDYIYFPISLIVVFISRCYVKMKFRFGDIKYKKC